MVKNTLKTNPSSKASPKKGILEDNKLIVISGSHPFFENPNRVGSDGIVMPIVVFGNLQNGLVNSWYLSPTEVEALYYLSLKHVYMERLNLLQPEIKSLGKKILTKEKQERVLLSNLGTVFLAALRILNAVPKD